MTLRVSGKNLDIGAALRGYVQARIDATLTKYGAGPIIGHVTIEPEGSGYRTDCTLHLNSGTTLQVDAKAREPYASFNRAADKIEKRVRRHRKRRSDHHVSSQHEEALAEPDAASPTGSEDAPSNGATDGFWREPQVALARNTAAEPAWLGLNPAIIAEPCSGVPEMTVSNAVKELDLTNAPVVVFRHAFDGRTNIVYRRPDGNIGWIDPDRR
ncbi:ribosome hibernation-promoting factor, HPF/YfiA family [Methylocapsa acidiphila]|uniref:ribosome hibernation-promoting factor, HPF/YfiA family n=1 Tax=Methylocapsa acidiphila TaxID=133552 RepID=UPI0004054F0F|nr:ribosome-associated translation inhibitor RaiA [Methylocapsa acidiphila]